MVKDTIELNAFNKVKMPRLKGHIKLTLHNCKTGKNEVYEGDNIVTDAVADILGANYAGGVDFNALAPLWSKWFGGVLCYETAHALNNGVLDPSDYFIKADSNQHVVAHAGQTAVDSEHDDDLSRGNPVGVAYVKTNNSIKTVFEWGSARGNGTIAALSLTHTDTGSFGTGGNYYDFINNFCPYDMINRADGVWNYKDLSTVKSKAMALAQYDESNALCFYIGEDNFDFNTVSDYVTVYINKLAYTKTGLFQTAYANTELGTKFTIQTPITFYAMPCYHFDYENKYLYLFTNATDSNNGFDNQNVKYCVIDCENQALVNLGTEQEPVYYKTIVSDTSNLTRLTLKDNGEWFINAGIFKEGNDIYLPITTNAGNLQNVTGFKRISLNSAEQTIINLGETLYYLPEVWGSKEMQIVNYKTATLNNAFVINGDNAWKCQSGITGNVERTFGHPVSSPNKVSSLVSPENRYRVAVQPIPRYIFANKLINSTKFNLPSSVQKTTSQSMTVEYTLTEVSENE